MRGLVDMGFPEDQVRAALAAAFNNSERAVEYLMSGIPEGLETGARPVAAAPAPVALGSSGGDPLLPLRNHPQINQLRQLVQSNPSALPMVLQQIGRATPQLLEVINANREAFVAMLNEPVTAAAPAPAPSTGARMPGAGGMPGGMDPRMLAQMVQALGPEQRAAFGAQMGLTPEQLTQFLAMMSSGMAGGDDDMGDEDDDGEEGVPPGATVIRLTEEENAAVERLLSLGFERQQVIEAYLICDKNEQLAANYLLENA